MLLAALFSLRLGEPCDRGRRQRLTAHCPVKKKHGIIIVIPIAAAGTDEIPIAAAGGERNGQQCRHWSSALYDTLKRVCCGELTLRHVDMGCQVVCPGSEPYPSGGPLQAIVRPPCWQGLVLDVRGALAFL